MPTACHFPLYNIYTTPTTHSITTIKKLTPKSLSPFNIIPTGRNCISMTCKASSSSSSCSSITDFDLYDLLGVDSSSHQSQIKMAYRMLQKRCHPDIMGPAGHDMAIILNQVYSILSDPNSRSAYDKEQAKIAELSGYTGKPLYSAWFGSENEERAVFVDEVKCVGCLKCALFAEKTFAIESVYGRARVVAQWADPEHKIQEAIETCPVDCISLVERSNLAALEFLMSKQPRGNVRLSMGNAAGARVSNIFVDVKKFQTRFKDAMEKSSTQHPKETDPQREARMSTIQAIRSISNWLYWQSPNANAGGSTPKSQNKLTYVPRKSIEPNMEKLRDAAASIKQARESTGSMPRKSSNYIDHEDYWIPSLHALPASMSQVSYNPSSATSKTSSTRESKEVEDRDYFRVENEDKDKQKKPMIWGVLPVVPAAVASVIIQLQVEAGSNIGGLKEHVGGPLALNIVNSSWSQVMLAGITWYIIGMTIIELVAAIQSRQRKL